MTKAAPLQPSRHQPFHRAPGHVAALPAQVQQHLVGTEPVHGRLPPGSSDQFDDLGSRKVQVRVSGRFVAGSQVRCDCRVCAHLSSRRTYRSGVRVSRYGANRHEAPASPSNKKVIPAA